MSPSTITLLFLLFAVIMFVLEKIPLGVTSMIVCIGLVVTGVLDVKTAFAGFIDRFHLPDPSIAAQHLFHTLSLRQSSLFHNPVLHR